MPRSLGVGTSLAKTPRKPNIFFLRAPELAQRTPYSSGLPTFANQAYFGQPLSVPEAPGGPKDTRKKLKVSPDVAWNQLQL